MSDTTPSPSLDPATVERKATRSRIAELVALVTVVSAMTGACASAASSIAHDVTAVRIAEAKAKVCP